MAIPGSIMLLGDVGGEPDLHQILARLPASEAPELQGFPVCRRCGPTALNDDGREQVRRMLERVGALEP